MKAVPVSARCVLVVLGALSLAACGGGGGGGGGSTPQPGATLSGSALKGPLAGAVIAVHELGADGATGDQVGTGISTGAGTYTITLTRRTAAPLLLQTSGGSYTDEATGSAVALQAGDALRTVLTGAPDPADPFQVAITPLTTMAAARAIALAQGGVPLADAIRMANAAVAQQYRLEDIVAIQAVDASDAEAVVTAERERRDYGLVLAGISELANSLGVSGIELTRALSADLSDGVLDGMNGATAVTMQPAAGGSPITMAATAGTSDLQAAIASFAASGRNATGLTDTTIATFAVPAGSATAGALRVTTTALPNFISGQAGSATIVADGGIAPYTCALEAGSSLPDGFSLSQNCVVSGSELLAGGTTRRIHPQFVVVVTDSSNPAKTAQVPLFISIVAEAPTIACGGPLALEEGQAASGAAVATASGGTPPYSFRSDSFFSGAPPLGMTVEPVPQDGTAALLSGTPGQGTGRTNPYSFGVCVVDQAGAGACCTASAVVTPPVSAMVVDPASLSFSAIQGGSNPVSQTLTVTNSGSPGSTLDFAVADDATWLTLQGSQADLDGGESATFQVNVNTAGLTAANSPYFATITVSSTTGSPQTVDVELVIYPEASGYDGTWDLQVVVSSCYQFTHTVPVTISSGQFSGHLFQYCSNPYTGATRLGNNDCGSDLTENVSIDLTITGSTIEGNFFFEGSPCNGGSGFYGNFDSANHGAAAANLASLTLSR